MDNLIEYNQYLSRVCEYVGIKNDIYNELLEILKNSGQRFYNQTINSHEQYKKMLEKYKKDISFIIQRREINYNIMSIPDYYKL